MKHTLTLINRYLLKNDLFNDVSHIGGNNTQCQVKMSVTSNLYRFIEKMKKYTKCRISLRLHKATDEGTITFRRYK